MTKVAMNIREIEKMTDPVKSAGNMPVLFIGHGNPMNAIEDNEFSRSWYEMGKILPRPNVILCISAHWETAGTFVTAMPKPQTIHDFGGFPPALFNVQYPAPGSPSTAREICKMNHDAGVLPDEKWGLDHGCWSVLNQMYPEAEIPVLEMSLDYRQSPEFHYNLAKILAPLRKKGVLIIGSGNMVHNLRKINWHNPAGGYDWAESANEKLKNLILDGNYKALMNFSSLGPDVNLAIPTPEHFMPLFYALALLEEKEKVTFFNDRLVMGSLSMTSMIISS
jgi:4,5-DOPA dioxygenase extradiol